MIGQDWQVVDLDLTDQNYEIFKARGLSYTQNLPVTGDPAYVKVIVYDYAADALLKERPGFDTRVRPAKGSVLASPSSADPDYFFHWLRDSAAVIEQSDLDYTIL